jgi:serine/threonine protein kinase
MFSKDNNASLKIRGFGIARQLNGTNDKCPAGRIGVPQFMAPEVVNNREYGFEADCWSMGVLLCLLLSGRLPFTGSIKSIYERTIVADYSLDSGAWSRISEPAKDLICKLLVVNIDRRLTAKQCLQHPFLTDRSIPQRAHLPETVESIRRYNQRRKLKVSHFIYRLFIIRVLHPIFMF